jgi:hypothetical protein
MWKTLIALTAVVVTLAPAASAQVDPFIPGRTDFPNGVRVADRQRAEFIPGRTDFPNGLRRVPARTARAAPVVVASATPASGFDWGDAGIGGGATGATLLVLAGLSVSLRRRGRIPASP